MEAGYFFQRLADLIAGNGAVAEADVSLAVGAEAVAGQGADAGLVEELVTVIVGGEAGGGDVGEGVEGALGHDA